MPFWLFLRPMVQSLLNQVRFADREKRWRSLFLFVMGLAFAVLLFVLAFRMLAYFRSVEVLGEYLARYLLQGVLVVFFGLLFFSNVIAGLSRLYLSGDLDLCHAAPVPLEGLFLSRFVLTLVDSSWMLLIFGVPILSAYGLVFDARPAFYFTLFHMCLAMAIISGGLGVLLTMILVRVFPARRTRDMVMLLTLVMMVALYIFVRFLRPERLADPEGFFTLMQYLDSLKGVRSPLFPARWIAETLWGALMGSARGGQGFHVLLSWTTAFALVYINVWTACLIYAPGFSRVQEGRKKRARGRILDRSLGFVFGRRGRDLAALAAKDVRTFLRDNTQWSQLLLLAGLVIVYVYNFSVLPLDQVPLEGGFLLNEMAFFNMGLAGFVLTALATRFVFPAVSSDGEAYWIIRCAPVGLSRYLTGKCLLFFWPMAVVGEFLVVVTNALLGVRAFMMVLTSVTMLFLTLGIVALAVGLGATYPKFKQQSIAQVSTGFGGVVYMMVSLAFIGSVVGLELWPAHLLFITAAHGGTISWTHWGLFAGVSGLIVMIMALAVWQPLRIGISALKAYE
jgi:ABC-2 type transport system permease protein